jgi:nucleotide-binding universal stress UspA family protein
VTVAHRISQGIVDTAEEEDCNFIIQGRKKEPGFLERYFYTVIDTTIQKSPYELAVLHGDVPPGKMRKLLIPFGENVHTRLALEVAPSLATYFECEVEVAIVVPPETPEPERQEKVKDVEELLRENGLQARTVVVGDSDVVRGVVRRARDADLVVMGGRTGTAVELLLGSSLSEEITQRVKCPVLWIEEFEEKTSILARFFRSTRAES